MTFRWSENIRMMIPKNRESSGIGIERRTTHDRNQNSDVGRAPAPDALAQDRRSQQVLDLHRQFAHALARRVMDRVGDGGGDAGQADLADPARRGEIHRVIERKEQQQACSAQATSPSSGDL